MNRRTEEELLNAAFGDISPEDAARIDSFLAEDAEAAKAYGTYTMMRDGLRDLREVPEHQLSTERLRTAILAQGIQQKRPFSLVPWLWAPAAAAAALFGYIAFTKAPQTSAIDNSLAMVATRPAAQPASDDAGSVADIQTPEATEGTVAMTTAPTRPSIARTASRRPKSRLVRNEPIGIVAYNTRFGPDVSDYVSMKKSNDGIILIQPERDIATGASRATEVESAKNVVIGG